MTTERRGKGRVLTDDEVKLWQGVAASVEPLKRARKRRRVVEPAANAVSAVSTPANASGAGKIVPSPQTVSAEAQPKVRTKKPVVAVTAKPATPKKPPMADFEARAARKLAAGKLSIDARIDLHGMRQDEARAALRRFLFVAQQRGYRHVKVITGKGRKQDQDAPFELFDDRRGVLRQSVPDWLSAPDLRDVVVSFTSAGRSHGGDGALYVRIRRPR